MPDIIELLRIIYMLSPSLAFAVLFAFVVIVPAFKAKLIKSLSDLLEIIASWVVVQAVFVAPIIEPISFFPMVVTALIVILVSMIVIIIIRYLPPPRSTS